MVLVMSWLLLVAKTFVIGIAMLSFNIGSFLLLRERRTGIPFAGTTLVRTVDGCFTVALGTYSSTCIIYLYRSIVFRRMLKLAASVYCQNTWLFILIIQCSRDNFELLQS